MTRAKDDLGALGKIVADARDRERDVCAAYLRRLSRGMGKRPEIALELERAANALAHGEHRKSWSER